MQFIKQLLDQHGCTFVKNITECRIIWKNKVGYEMCDDVCVLSNMTEAAWDFWSNYQLNTDLK